MRRALACNALSRALRLAEWVREPHEGVLEVGVCRGRVEEFVKFLSSVEGARFSTTVGTDLRPLEGVFRVTHVVALDRLRKYLLVNIDVPPSHPVIPSVTPLMPAADWAEREAMDMIGVRFDGHPNPFKLVLPDPWPSGIHPLRKDFPYNRKLVGTEVAGKGLLIGKSFSSGLKRGEEELKSECALIPLGPYHPALHEPEYFEIYVDGEKIVDARYRGFFVHRGIEKVAESRMTINQVPFIAERICGICGYTHSCCYCQAVEAAAGIKVPDRARYIRSLMLEIERIHSHLLWFGVAFHLLGFDTGFMAMWRIREDVMRVAEALTGNRKMYGLNLVGGVRRDINEDKASLTLRVMDRVEAGFKEFCSHVLGMSELVERIKEVGVLSREDAVKLGAVGPHARASGVDIDVRRDHPYAAYGEVGVNVAVRDEGDVLARVMVRFDEVLESIRLVRELIKSMPKGDLMAEYGNLPPGRVGLGATEAPRGEDIHYVVTGYGNKLYRWRPRAPSYMNIPTIPLMLRGERLANAPIIIASIDPCFSCTDHYLVINVRTGSRRVLSADELVGGVVNG